METTEAPRVMPEFTKERLSESVNLLVKDGDPRKTAYARKLFLDTRQFWKAEDNRTPMVFEMFETEGLLIHDVIPSDAVQSEIIKGRSVKPRRDHYEGRKHMVPEHMLTVMMGANALAELVSEEGLLSQNDIRDVVVAAALHDLNKPREYQLVTESIDDPNKGYGQAGYDKAGIELNEKLTDAHVPKDVIEITQSVGHASCPEIEVELTKNEENLSPILLKKLILHYIDDIVTNPNIIDPAMASDDYGNTFNALDRRCMQNENNPKYKNYNQAWTNDPRNKTDETAFGMQRRVGHLVESVFAEILGISDPLQLPAIIYERMQQDVQTHWELQSNNRKFREQKTVV